MVNLGLLIVVGLTFLINLIVAQVMLGFFWQITIIPKEYRLLAEALMLMMIMLGLSFTPVGRRLFRWSNNFVVPRAEEMARLRMILAPVFTKSGKEAADFQIYIAEQDILNAYASGVNEIAVTRPLLALSDYELQGILAHEIGHLHYKDGVFLTIINTMNLVTIISFKVLNVFNVVLCVLTRLPLLGLAAALLSWAIVLFSYLVMLLSIFPQKIGLILSRQQEYRVDCYAAQIGFGDHLIAGLQRIDAVEKPSLWERVVAFLHSTHPATHDRIEKIRQIS